MTEEEKKERLDVIPSLPLSELNRLRMLHMTQLRVVCMLETACIHIMLKRKSSASVGDGSDGD